MHALRKFADIIVSPQPVNTSINKVAEFNCTAIANVIIWKANGMTLQDTNQIEIFETVNALQGIFMSTLAISVSSVDNATNITCISATITNSVTAVNESEPVLLLVQGNYNTDACRLPLHTKLMHTAGLLESVSHLTVILINSSTVLISWSPPFTLEGIPILGYNVTITTYTMRQYL